MFSWVPRLMTPEAPPLIRNYSRIVSYTIIIILFTTLFVISLLLYIIDTIIIIIIMIFIPLLLSLLFLWSCFERPKSPWTIINHPSPEGFSEIIRPLASFASILGRGLFSVGTRSVLRWKHGETWGKHGSLDGFSWEKKLEMTWLLPWHMEQNGASTSRMSLTPSHSFSRAVSTLKRGLRRSSSFMMTDFWYFCDVWMNMMGNMYLVSHRDIWR